MDLVLDTIQAGHQQCSKAQVGVGCRVREARFDAACFRAGNVRDTDGSRAVAGGVGQHDRRFEAGNQTLVGVGGRVGERVQRLAVLDDAADEVQGGVRQAGVAFASEGVGAVFGNGHVNVHTGTVVAVQRLRHEGSGLAERVGNVVHAVLQGLYFVGLLHQGVEQHADFVLAGSCHFVVVNFNGQAHFFQCVAHGGTDFVVVVDRRNREVAALDARTMTFVASLEIGVGVPGSLLREDLEHGAGDVGLEFDFVEYEEFRLRTNEYGVTDTGGLQVFLGALGDTARVALVALHGGGLNDVADDDQRRLFGERVQNGSAVIGHEDHVGGFDAFPAGNRGAVEHLAVFEEVIIDITCRHGDVLLLALGIGEAQVYPLHVMLVDQLHRFRHGFLQQESFARQRVWRLI